MIYMALNTNAGKAEKAALKPDSPLKDRVARMDEPEDDGGEDEVIPAEDTGRKIEPPVTNPVAPKQTM